MINTTELFGMGTARLPAGLNRVAALGTFAAMNKISLGAGAAGTPDALNHQQENAESAMLADLARHGMNQAQRVRMNTARGAERLRPANMNNAKLGAAAAAGAAGAENQSDSQTEDPGARQQQKNLEKYARRLVAQTFYGQMLKEMRNSPFKSEIFDGGRGGQAFNSMFDQELAQHMAGGKANKLVRALVHQLQRKANAASHGASPLNQKNGTAPSTGSQKTNPFKDVKIHVAPGFGN